MELVTAVLFLIFVVIAHLNGEVISTGDRARHEDVAE